MKKLKLLPTVLMLVLCVGVLAIGVFAITPTKNTISGTITINSANTPVSIQLLVDGVEKGDPVTVRSGTTIEVGDIAFGSIEGDRVADYVDKLTFTLVLEDNVVTSHDLPQLIVE